MVFAGLIIRYIIVRRAEGKLHTLETLKKHSCLGIVLGARVLEDNRPSKMLEDRLHTAVEGFRRGLFHGVVVTGKSEEKQNEIQVMVEYLEENGIPRDSIIKDGGSHTTKKSFQRLGLFHTDKECILITQRFHLPRSLFLAEEYGFTPLGLIADRQKYNRGFLMVIREFFATTKDVLIPRKPLPDAS